MKSLEELVLSIQKRQQQVAKQRKADTEISRLKEENSRLKEENSCLKEENSCLKEENSHLKEENSCLKEENSHLKEEKSRLRGRISKLSAEIKHLKSESDDKDARTMCAIDTLQSHVEVKHQEALQARAEASFALQRLKSAVEEAARATSSEVEALKHASAVSETLQTLVATPHGREDLLRRAVEKASGGEWGVDLQFVKEISNGSNGVVVQATQTSAGNDLGKDFAVKLAFGPSACGALDNESDFNNRLYRLGAVEKGVSVSMLGSYVSFDLGSILIGAVAFELAHCDFHTMSADLITKFRETSEDIYMDTWVKLCYQFAAHLTFLQQNGFLHGDVKLCNSLVFIREDGSYDVKICDFGSAHHRGSSSGVHAGLPFWDAWQVESGSTPEYCQPAADRPMPDMVHWSFDRFSLFASMAEAVGYLSARDFFAGDRLQAVSAFHTRLASVRQCEGGIGGDLIAYVSDKMSPGTAANFVRLMNFLLLQE